MPLNGELNPNKIWGVHCGEAGTEMGSFGCRSELVAGVYYPRLSLLKAEPSLEQENITSTARQKMAELKLFFFPPLLFNGSDSQKLQSRLGEE